MLSGSISKMKIDSVDSLLEKGESNPDSLEFYKGLVLAQKKFIEQQKLLIDWLTDRRNAQRSNQSFVRKYKFLLCPLAIVISILITILVLLLLRDKIFNSLPTFPPTDPNTTNYVQEYPVYDKTNWGGLLEKAASEPLPSNLSVVIISHTATDPCRTFKECSNRTQQIQYSFMEKGHNDIGYNFLIGGDGGIYVGRGWSKQNYIRSKSISISFIGDFNKQLLTSLPRRAGKALIEEGVLQGRLSGDYKLIGENQTSPLRYYSPGWNLVKEIQKWSHYFNGTML